jgi:hypothetical protein
MPSLSNFCSVTLANSIAETTVTSPPTATGFGTFLNRAYLIEPIYETLSLALMTVEDVDGLCVGKRFFAEFYS